MFFFFYLSLAQAYPPTAYCVAESHGPIHVPSHMLSLYQFESICHNQLSGSFELFILVASSLQQNAHCSPPPPYPLCPFCLHTVFFFVHCNRFPTSCSALVLGCLLVIIASLASHFCSLYPSCWVPCSSILSCETITISHVCLFAQALIFTLDFIPPLLFALIAFSPSLAIIPCCASSNFHKFFTFCFPFLFALCAINAILIATSSKFPLYIPSLPSSCPFLLIMIFFLLLTQKPCLPISQPVLTKAFATFGTLCPHGPAISTLQSATILLTGFNFLPSFWSPLLFCWHAYYNCLSVSLVARTY